MTQHHMHSEFYVVEEEQARLINETKAAGGRVICVGTTSCRTLESAAGADFAPTFHILSFKPNSFNRELD